MAQFPHAPKDKPYPEGLMDYVYSWLADPCWDLYDCPDEYQEYHALFYAFQLAQEIDWEEANKKRREEKVKHILDYPDGIPGYIIALEYKIDQLQRQIDTLINS